jgi:hypothetical protein
MSDYPPALKQALDRIAPSFAGERGDWQRVLRDAGVHVPSRTRGDRPLLRTRRRRRVVAVIAAAALLAIVAVPALGVGRDLFPLRFLVPGEPQPLRGPAVVTSGTSSGARWTLTAYTTRRGICVDLETPKGGGGSCGGYAGTAIGPSATGFSNEIPSVRFAYGAVAERVAAVKLLLADRTVVAVEPLPAPAELDVPLRFYIVELRADAVVRAIVAEDASGVVLETRHVRPEPRR